MRPAIVRCTNRYCRHRFEALLPDESDGQMTVELCCPVCNRRIGQGIFVRWVDEGADKPAREPASEPEPGPFSKLGSAAGGLRRSDIEQGGVRP